jgi:uncharacterized ion transporter superfamily protein YfcC
VPVSIGLTRLISFVTKNKKSSGPRTTQKITARERREAKTQKTGSSSSKTHKRQKIIKTLFLKHFSSFILTIYLIHSALQREKMESKR